ncbi:MAG: DUF5011 domain-containing protein [Clostridia bacterium]|nr:DUF5011 domain-containing protein [Clostridia bacterium]
MIQINHVAMAIDEVTYEGNPTGLTGDDRNTSFPIGFDFIFYGNTYSTAYVSTNGVISFGAGTSSYSNTTLPASISNVILPFWDDLTVAQNTIMYQTIGEAPNRQLVMQWTNMFFFGTSTQLGTFQVILYEGSNKIQMQYRTLMGDARSYGNNCTIGIQSSSSSTYTQYSCNQENAIYEKQAISFTPSGSTYSMNTNDTYQYIYLISPLMPGVPVLSDGALYDGATNVPLNATVEWGAVDRATSYKVYLATDSNFSTIIINQPTSATSYTLSGLNNLTTYYLRVEAINSYGSNMSNQISFTTASAVQSAPAVTTGSVSNLDYTSLDVGGNITSLGVPSPSQYGHVYNTTGSPTISDNRTSLGGVYSTGTYSSSLTGLTEGETYHIRAYATNAAGTSYGDEITATTLISNHAPSALDDASNVTEDSYVDIDVLDNDTDADSDELTITVISAPSHGTATENPDHTIRYTPFANYDQSDSFTYTISDTHSATSTATVSITVDAINDLPDTPSFITPTGSEKLKGGDSIVVSYSASTDIDSSGDISYAVDFYDGDQWINNVYTGTNTSFTFTGTSSISTDAAKFRVKAIDSDDGESSSVSSSSFMIDSDAPSSLTINRSDSTWTNSDVTFTITGGEDVLSGIDERLYKVDDGTWTAYADVVTISEEGTHLIQAKAIDNVGNVVNASDVTIYIDKTVPEAPVIHASATSWTNDDVTFTVSGGTDTLSGLDRIDYKIDSGEWLLYSDEVTISTEGIHLIQVRATDNARNSSNALNVSIFIDKTKPDVSLIGESEVTVLYQETYVEPGITSSDSLSGVSHTVISGASVNVEVLGTYVITYDVFDHANNKSDTLTRTVSVVDQGAPVITLTGDADVTIELGDPYVEYYATAYDNHDGDISSAIMINNPVNIWSIGDYQVTYSVTDSSMNQASAVIRNVHVIDLSIDRKVDNLLSDLTIPGNVAALTEAISEYDEISNEDAVVSLEKTVKNMASQQEDSPEFMTDFIEITEGIISQILEKTTFSSQNAKPMEKVIEDYLEVYNTISEKSSEVKDSAEKMIETLVNAFSQGIPSKAKENISLLSTLSFSSPESVRKMEIISELISDIKMSSPDIDIRSILGNSSLKVSLLDSNSKSSEDILIPGSVNDMINEIGMGVSLEGKTKTMLIPSGTFNISEGSKIVISISSLNSNETVSLSQLLEEKGITPTGFNRKIEFNEQKDDKEKTPILCQQYVTTTFALPGYADMNLDDLHMVMTDESDQIVHVMARVYQENGMVYVTFNQNQEGVYSLVTIDSELNGNDSRLLPLMKLLGVADRYMDSSLEDAITREEMANIVNAILHLKADNNENYNDISLSPYKEDIQALTSAAIMQGYGDGTFRPEKTVSKQEAITVMLRMLAYIKDNSLLDYEQKTSSADFTDMDEADSWAKESIREIGAVLVDNQEDMFYPDAIISSKEFFELMENILKMIGLQ